jgi:hypothetical protein
MSPDSLRKLHTKCVDNIQEFLTKLRTHRIYITQLIPFDNSEGFVKPLETLGLATHALCTELEEGKPREYPIVQELVMAITSSIDLFETQFAELRSGIDSIKKDILAGRTPKAP